MTDKDFDIIFKILSSEQQILQRSDQKAFTLLSILGVFLVFFIVHYTNIPPNVVIIGLIVLYFVSALISILSLLLVISPRIQKDPSSDKNSINSNPTFFAGIVHFKSADAYAAHLKKILSSSENTYQVFTDSVFSISKINSYKNKYLRRGIIAFVAAIGFEVIIIISMYVSLAIERF